MVVRLAVDVGRLERGHRVGVVVVGVVVVVVEGLEKELGRSCHTALKVCRRGQRKGKGWCWWNGDPSLLSFVLWTITQNVVKRRSGDAY